MKLTDLEIEHRAVKRLRITRAEMAFAFRMIRDETIEECCEVVCLYCKHGFDDDHSVACRAIRDHFRETSDG
jgi:hypothetical protein